MTAITHAEVLAVELAAAQRSAWNANAQGARFQTIDAATAAGMVEDAAERAAICAEGAVLGLAVGGLVSSPTTQTEHAAYRVKEGSRALRAALRVTEQDKNRRRIAMMRRSVGFGARAIEATASKPGFRDPYVVMITLTYEAAEDWKPVHMTSFTDVLRKHCQRSGFDFHYVWVGELQQRGALHYHMAVWLPAGVTLPKPDTQGWWPHGSTRIEAARDAVAYLMKYLSKGSDTSNFPKGARMHGQGGVEHALRRARRWLGYPAWVKARADIHDDWGRAKGGGWVDPEGTVIPSEYVRAWLGDRWGPLRVADYGRPFEVEGPFQWISCAARAGKGL